MSAEDKELFSSNFRTGAKTLFVDLKSNSNGNYLKIRERNRSKSSTILIPSDGISKLIEALKELEVAGETNNTQGSKSEEAKVSRRRRQVQSKSDNTPEVDNQSKTKKEKKITKSKTNAHPSKKFILFVSNLSDETLGKNLRIHFNPVARVKVAQVNIFSRKHTGTGYVTFYSEEDALKACTELHGSMLDGNQISCTLEIPVKEPKEEKIQLEVSGLSTTDSTIPTENIVKVEVPTKLFVKNFKYEITQEELLELANRFGTAVSVELLTSRKGKSLGQAIFEYSTEEEASNALESLNQMEFNERHLLVRRYFAT